MKITINLEHLHETNLVLFNQIKRHFDGRMHGTETIDLPIAFAEAVKRWQANNPVELWEEQQKQAQKDKDKARIKKDQTEAVARLDGFWAAQGLLPSDHNVKTIRDFIVKGCEGYLCAQNVDAAINVLRDQLEWAQPAAPAPPPAPTPEPVVEYIEGTNEVRLPLGTVPRQRHSLVQLKDLARREQEAKAQQVRTYNNAFAAAFNKQIEVEL